jgi:hypothetical protein
MLKPPLQRNRGYVLLKTASESGQWKWTRSQSPVNPTSLPNSQLQTTVACLGPQLVFTAVPSIYLPNQYKLGLAFEISY